MLNRLSQCLLQPIGQCPLLLHLRQHLLQPLSQCPLQPLGQLLLLWRHLNFPDINWLWTAPRMWRIFLSTKAHWPKVWVLSCSSLEHLPFDHGPNQALTLCQVNENLTLKVFCHLNIHLACDPNSKNKCLEPLNVEPPVVIKSLQKTYLLPCWIMGRPMPLCKIQMSMLADASTMDINDLQDLVGYTFLMDKHANHWAHIQLMDFIQMNVEKQCWYCLEVLEDYWAPRSPQAKWSTLRGLML